LGHPICSRGVLSANDGIQCLQRMAPATETSMIKVVLPVMELKLNPHAGLAGG